MSKQKIPNKFLDITSTTGINTNSAKKNGATYANQDQIVAPNANGLCMINRAEFNLNQVTQITSAQLLALNATPITMIPAPGAGYAVIVTGWSVWHGTGTAYAGIAAGEDLALKYTDGSGAVAAGVIETTGFLDQTTAQLRYASNGSSSSAGSVTPSSITPVANAAIVAQLLSGEITTGDFAINVQVFYNIIPVDLTSGA